ncbi:hypothetical protein TNCV_4276621 [Trichonephila clavipes]|nr:hypothetical protein TNCV_4276621 [Trichonephila clavipes]
MRARAYCAHPSTLDHWRRRCMSSCPDQVVILRRGPQCLSPQASLILIYRPTAVGLTLPSPGMEPGPVVWKRNILPLDHWVTCDEAHFWLNGYVNKQNCRILSEANPQVYVETPLHPEKLTVWCALWAGGILLQKR